MSGPAGIINAFAQATAVLPVGDDGAGRYSAEIHPGWDIGGNANGGYLMAIAGRAMTEAVGRPPVSLTAHSCALDLLGPCEIDVEVVRSGRRLATARATMTVEGKPTLELLGTFGEQAPDDGPSYQREGPARGDAVRGLRRRCSPPPRVVDRV